MKLSKSNVDSSNFTVFIHDNDLNVTYEIKNCLKTYNITSVFSTTSQDELFNFLENNTCNVLLLAYHMNGYTADDIMPKIRKITDAKIIILIGNEYTPPVITLSKLPVDGYCVKSEVFSIVIKVLVAKNAFEREQHVNLTFGEKIIYLREQKSMSQQQLAEEIGVSRQMMSKYENNGAEPNCGILVKLVKVLNADIKWLLSL